MNQYIIWLYSAVPLEKIAGDDARGLGDNQTLRFGYWSQPCFST